VNIDIGRELKEDFENHQEKKLLKRLLDRYPDLKYIPFA